MLDDDHSSYRGADGTNLFEGSIRCGFQSIGEVSTPETVGYVRVNSFSGSANSSDAISFAQDIQNQIISQDNSNTQGWIIDLRGNGGGNMWPMLAGVGPVLGEGIAGYFINADEIENSWGYQNDASLLNDDPVTQLNDFYTLNSQNPKVAVLLDDGVASSGEVIAISFIGRENTRSFGSPTCGISTSNGRFTLSDGTVLNLTNAFLADRNKNKYGIPVEPDEDLTDEDLIQSAVD
ncbi:S41 family peptidase [Psychroflexus tropicus]|uniref:S41 family peptidase n=1 Tax=Psychroflexus tropicus TaxID=197345 RepID=UPI00036FFB57|nr:S41 family peptidase [Psychroflexus tropicus]